MAVSYRVASRYAKSLTELAQEKSLLDNVHADMLLFVDVYDKNRDFQLMLESPIINHGKKLNILETLFKKNVSDLTMSFFTIITKKNRERDLYGIAKQVLVKYNEIKGIQTAEVKTAVALPDGLKKEFSDIVSKAIGKEVDLQETVNEDLIGGYILRVEDKQIDNSVKSNLQKLRHKFDGN